MVKAKATIEFVVDYENLNQDAALSQIIMDLLSEHLNVKTVSIDYLNLSENLNQTDQLKTLVVQLTAVLDKINLSIAKLRVDAGFKDEMVSVYNHLGIMNKWFKGLEPEVNALAKSIDKLHDPKGYLLTDPTQCPNCKSKII